MKEQKGSRPYRLLLSVLAFLMAGLLQYFDETMPFLFECLSSLLSNIIFLSLIFLWGKSIRERIIQEDVRRLLLLICCLLFFWLFIRNIKYLFTEKESILSRYLWYLYYVPQCLVPPFSFLMALRLTKKREKKKDRLGFLILIPAFILIISILTNDIHQKAFLFKPGFEDFSSDYRHGPIFYLAIFWIAALVFLSLLTLFFKSGISACRRRTWIPLLTFLLCSLICTLCFRYAIRSYKIPELLSFSFILIIESCVWIGLIPSNQNYEIYSDHSKIRFVLTDKDLNPVKSTIEGENIPVFFFKEAIEKERVLINQDERLSHIEIHGGHSFFLEDLSGINRLLERLSNANEILKEERELITYENDLKKKRITVEKKNALYDEIYRTNLQEMNRIQTLIEKTHPGSPDFRKDLLMASVYLAYIKRRSNLAIINTESDTIDIREISLSIQESIRALKELEIHCLFQDDSKGRIDTSKGILLYEFFQSNLSERLNTMRELLVHLYRKDTSTYLRVVNEDDGYIIPSALENRIREKGGDLLLQKENGYCYTTICFSEEKEHAL